MRFGIGPGPVFAYEWLRISRRPRLYAGRAAFVGAILAALLACAPDSHPRRPYLSADETAAFARRAHRAAAAVEMLLILFIAPAATAGAICLDRERGALVQVMATDLTDAEIVLGKLAAALIPVVGLLLAALPVQMLLCLLGGVDPSALAGAFAGILATGVLACTLAFALSAWGRKAHEVLAAAYLLIFLWLTAYPFVALAPRFRAWLPPPWDGAALALLKATHPYPIVEPPFNEGFAPFAARVATYVGACLGVSAGLVVATIVSIRPLALRRASGVERPRRRLPALLPEPSLDANPVLWREWCRARPSAWGRATWAVYGLIGLGAAATALYDVAASPGPRFTVAPVLANMFIVGFGLLLVAVRSATTLSEERVRGTLDVLLATPMTTPEILAGKWWGAFRLALGLATPAVVVGAAACLRSAEWANLAWLTALILAYGAAVTSLGLALAVRVPRQGAALALTVGLYLATCTGWAWYGTIHYTGDVDTGRAIAMGAPHWGAGFGTESVANSHVLDPTGVARLFPAWLIVWAAAYGLLAAALFSAAARSFDASLGRMPARGGALRALVPSFRRPRPAMLEEARP